MLGNSDVNSAGVAVAITPNDNNPVGPTRAIYVGTAGDLAVRMVGGMNATFSAVPAGTLLPIQVNRVLFTGTTASGILGLS